MKAHFRVFCALLAAAACSACGLPALTPTPDASFRARPPEVAEGTRLRIPEVQRTTLANGLTVLVMETPESETLRVTFADRAATDDTETPPGLAALSVLAVSSGTLMADGRIERTPQLLGEKLSSAMLGCGVAFRLDALPAEAEPAFELLARVVQRPALDDEALRRARAQATRRNSSESVVVFRSLERMAADALYGHDNPFAHFVYGSAEERAAISDEAVRKFYAARYQPRQSALLVVGPLAAARAFALAKASFEAWHPVSAPVAVADATFAVVPPERRPSGLGLLSSAPGANLVMLLPCPRRDSPDTYAGDLTATLIGKLWSSGLNARLRHDASTSYFTSAECVQTRTGGVFKIELDSEPGQFATTLDTIQEQLDRLARAPVAESELADARSLYLGKHAISSSTSAGLESILLDQFSNDLPDQYAAGLEAHVKATTPADIQTFARRYLTRQNTVLAVQGSKQLLADPLTRFGNTVWKSASQAQRGE
ncbi:MAG TPA: pitrilysin family protein [Polyangiaceae bacterium]|jgi:zinc protease|nr:pitrilysin family protein [Polyangiaceae bacterium]